MDQARAEKLWELHHELERGRLSRRQFIRMATALGISLTAAEALAGCQKATPEPTAAPTQAQAVATTAPQPTSAQAAPTAAPTAAPAQPAAAEPKEGYMLRFDGYRCTGCLLCAVTCAEKWQAELFPEQTKDVVNLEFSRIRPMRFQYVDVVNVCNYCKLEEWAEGTKDAPCMSVCPQKAIKYVPKGEGKPGYTGYGYKTVDRELCLGLDACGRCLEACEQQFGSGMSFDPIEHKAQVCTMCGGDPACVKVCPEPEALQFVPVVVNGRSFALQPEAYAEVLYMKMFNVRRDL
mgnify:CR=1 FL=1